MEAAAQLRVDPFSRISGFSSEYCRNGALTARISRFRKVAGVVKCIATEPRPADTSTNARESVNGASRTAGATVRKRFQSFSRSLILSFFFFSVFSTFQRMQDVSMEIKRVRAQMEENEQLAILMRGLRGQNLKDSQFADDNIKLRLVEVDESSEFLPLVYDPDSIAAYWRKRPRAVATRIVQLLSVAGGFLSRLSWDLINSKIKENEVSRAIELREIVTSLGPAYIKLGQALSIRPDILSPAAMTELQKLCDKVVPSFPDDVAMALIEEELGQPWYNIYSELSSSPIAAASLGQVYKGRLKDSGDLVAVKVQRPFVLETVTVDLFIIRNLGLALRKFPQISIDIVGLVDEWAARFFEELDYVNEGENGTLFAEMMKKDLPQVVVPKTYHKYTARKVLTTQWIDGEKLSQSTESDVGELVNVGVICYLKQVL
ncbi:hypothetical protein M569_01954, partial [Genlisea aurea]